MVVMFKRLRLFEWSSINSSSNNSSCDNVNSKIARLVQKLRQYKWLMGRFCLVVELNLGGSGTNGATPSSSNFIKAAIFTTALVVFGVVFILLEKGH